MKARKTMKNQPLIQGGYLTDLATVQPQDPRYQEGLFWLAFAAEGTV